MDAILTVNVGSSNLKYALFKAKEPLERITHGSLEISEHHDLVGALLSLLLSDYAHLTIQAVCHRVVHGGNLYTQPVMINEEIITKLHSLENLAPLHMPAELEAIEHLKAALSIPHIACFDTAFHYTQPEIATSFALPRSYHEQGIRRYGFHGLSYEYIASILPDIAGDKAHGRVIVAHLGNGASMCAMVNRKSIATSMGFSALDGLMMGTRCGSIDPGVLLYLMEQDEMMDAQKLSTLLYKKSGLLGVSGVSHDVRDLEASPDPFAREALELFAYRAAREMGSLMMTCSGLDLLVFTGGIGEHSATVRSLICKHLEWMGIMLDTEKNLSNAQDITMPHSKASIYIIPTNEELMMARSGLSLLRA